MSVETDLNKLVITARVGQFNKLCDSFQDKFDNLTDTCQGAFIKWLIPVLFLLLLFFP